VSEELAGHEVVCLQDSLNIVTPDTNRYAHDHVLRTLDDLAVDLEKVGSLQSLKAEVLVLKISVVDNGGVKLLLMSHNTLISLLGNHG
jgi:hypothetical protein